MDIGELLKETRQEKNLTIAQVANELLIQEKYIQAIEEGNYEIIPGEVYQRAYFKQYSEYLGLKDYIDSMTRSRQIKPEKRTRHLDDIFGGTWDLARWGRVSLKIALIILIPVFVIFAITSSNDEPDEPDDTERVSGTRTLEVVPTDTEEHNWSNPSDPGESSSIDQPALLDHEIKLTATGRCWVTLITLDGEIFNGEMVRGEVIIRTDPVGFCITAGRPENLVVEFNGELAHWESNLMKLTLPPGAFILPDD